MSTNRIMVATEAEAHDHDGPEGSWSMAWEAYEVLSNGGYPFPTPVFHRTMVDSIMERQWDAVEAFGRNAMLLAWADDSDRPDLLLIEHGEPANRIRPDDRGGYALRTGWTWQVLDKSDVIVSELTLEMVDTEGQV